MKLNNLFRYTLLLVFFIASGNITTSCTDGFEDLNTSNIEVDPGDLPFAAQFQEPMTYCYPPQQNMFQFWTNLSIDFYGGYFMTPNGNFGNGNYGENRGHSGGMFENYYLHIFNNTRRLIAQCDKEGKPAVAGVMRIVQAYGTLMTTDTYGPIAYKSAIENAETAFAYDKQEDIYNYMLEDLDKAVTALKSTSEADASIIKAADFWCGGDVNLWIRVANTLKLRMAMRIVKVKPDIAKIKAEEAFADGVLTDANHDILIDKGLENEMWLMTRSWGDCGFNASLVTIMTGFKDPRIDLYMTKNTAEILYDGYEKTKDSNNNTIYIKKGDKDKNPVDKSVAVKIDTNEAYLGMRIGSGLPPKPNQWGNFSGWLDGTYAMALPIMKVAEAYFLRAEGALRGWNMGGTAKELYEQGIRTSIKNELAYRGSYAGIKAISEDAISQYINGTAGQDDFIDPINDENSIQAMNTLGVKWDEGASNEEKLQRIITQKWLANFPLSNEAWAEYRRTGYPKLFPVRVNASNGNVDTDEQIRRSLYSSIAYDTNEMELMKGIELLNQENSSKKFKGDIGGTRVWWDRADKGNF